MKFAAILMLGISFGLVSQSLAQTNVKEGVQSFQQGNEAWRRTVEEKFEISQNLIDAMGSTAATNIMESEAVFCYRIASKPSGYQGYTINNMAVNGFCGVLEDDLKNLIVKQFFATPGNISQDVERCVIQPRLLLRFVRGVDFTDVLFSSPCHSFSVFYGGKVNSYNFKPGAEIIEVMVEAFQPKTIEFVSPTALRQMLPIGVAQTQEQKAKLAKQGGPVRNWDADKAQQPDVAPKTGGGWNNLKM